MSHFYFCKQTHRIRMIVVFLCGIFLINTFDSIKTSSIVIIDENTVILYPFEYHLISVNATKGQALSGDWEATPADVLSPPFLVFIVDSENLLIWEASDNLTQAAKRIPADRLLYLYDPYFILDDIPFDNYRSGTFQVKVPFDDTWHLVLYAGATIIPLTFSWHIDVFEGYFLDILMYSIGGVIAAAFIIIFSLKMVKDKKQTYEDELTQIINETKENLGERKEFASLEEEVNEEYIGKKNH